MQLPQRESSVLPQRQSGQVAGQVRRSVEGHSARPGGRKGVLHEGDVPWRRGAPSPLRGPCERGPLPLASAFRFLSPACAVPLLRTLLGTRTDLADGSMQALCIGSCGQLPVSWLWACWPATQDLKWRQRTARRA